MQPAPGFMLPTFHNGRQTDLSLLDFRGKWLIILFYGSDFSFV
jgi:alkyl hydroperoxide reductase subunit AhpC